MECMLEDGLDRTKRRKEEVILRGAGWGSVFQGGNNDESAVVRGRFDGAGPSCSVHDTEGTCFRID